MGKSLQSMLALTRRRRSGESSRPSTHFTAVTLRARRSTGLRHVQDPCINKVGHYMCVQEGVTALNSMQKCECLSCICDAKPGPVKPRKLKPLQTATAHEVSCAKMALLLVLERRVAAGRNLRLGKLMPSRSVATSLRLPRLPVKKGSMEARPVPPSSCQFRHSEARFHVEVPKRERSW